MKKKIHFLCLMIILAASSPSMGQETVFFEDFEGGWGSWYADNGVWDVGTPTPVPVDLPSPIKCAGTVLAGNYPIETDSRLISPAIDLPVLDSVQEQIRLCFWQWFSYSSGDAGYVQISTFNFTTNQWSAWSTLDTGPAVVSTIWTRRCVDITLYAGKRVRIGFFHTADGGSGVSTGWYIDDVDVVKKLPEFSGDFEAGYGDWYVDNGVWQVGSPTSGPNGCFEGQDCAGTVLAGNYPIETDSRLISPAIQLPDFGQVDQLGMEFYHWFSYSSGDYGQVLVSEYDEVADAWKGWIAKATYVGVSSVWTRAYIDLPEYAGKKIRVGFYNVADGGSGVSSGWYIDNIKFPGVSPTLLSKPNNHYAPPSCAASLYMLGYEPLGNGLIYHWQPLDGGTITGTGPSVEFDPPDTGLDYYRVAAYVTSEYTHISSPAKVIKVFTDVIGDIDGDGDIDGSDLRAFAAAFVPADLPRFAEEFGLVECE